MELLQSLQQLAKDIKSQPELALSPKQIEGYFEKVVLAARTPEGYEGLCWEIGVWLLLLADDRQSVLFNAYGYPAIRAALSGAIENGALPRGLGWYTSGFTPGDIDGDIMLGVLSHPAIQGGLKRSLTGHEFRLDLDYLDPSDQQLGNATVQFLANLHRAGLDRQVQLMWAARLVEHLSLENPARKAAVQLVLGGLLLAGRYVNALYWLQAHFGAKTRDDLQDAVFDVVSEVVKIASGLGESGYGILNGLSYDEDFFFLLCSSKRSQLLLAFIMLWLLFMEGFPARQDFIDQSADLLWADFPNITLFLKRVSRWALQISRQSSSAGEPIAAVDYLYAPGQRVQALEEIERDLQRPPAYRGRGPALEVWKECRDEVFAPLVSGLESVAGHKELKMIGKEIGDLEPGALVKNSEVYKSTTRHRKVETGLQKVLVSYFQRYIDELAHIADLCYRTIEAGRFVSQLEAEIRWGDLEQEYDGLAEQWPSLAGHFQVYLSPVLDEWAAGRDRLRERNRVS